MKVVQHGDLRQLRKRAADRAELIDADLMFGGESIDIISSWPLRSK
jgi:hypothetical protein